MSMTDPIADMFTRIRNAQATGKRTVAMPASRVKQALAKLLKDAGYISDAQVSSAEGKPVIERLERISRSGLRVYRGKGELPKILGGLGVSIVSTSAGIMTDVQARKKGLGGEVIGLVA